VNGVNGVNDVNDLNDHANTVSWTGFYTAS